MMEVKDLASKGLKIPPHACVSATAFQLSARYVEIYVLEISECSNEIGVPDIQRISIPVEYSDLQEAFSEEASNELPNHGNSDMKFKFKKGQEPRNTRLRPMSPRELEELRKYLEENLGKGWIRRSKSLVSAPIVFARKRMVPLGYVWIIVTLIKSL